MALEETIDDNDHDGDVANTTGQSNDRGHQHQSSASSSTPPAPAAAGVARRSIALWKIVVDTEPRPTSDMSDNTSTPLSNNPLHVDFESTTPPPPPLSNMLPPFSIHHLLTSHFT